LFSESWTRVFKRNEGSHRESVATLSQLGGFQPTMIYASVPRPQSQPSTAGRRTRDSMSNALTKPDGKGMLVQE
jgi:hypothetical protein